TALSQGPAINPMLFNDSDKSNSANSFSVGGVAQWQTLAQQKSVQSTSMVPLLRIKAGTATPNGTVLADIDFATAPAAAGHTGYQPAGGGAGGITAQQLLTVKFDTSKTATTTRLPLDSALAAQSPVSSGKAPSYASPIGDGDILQSRTAVFDISGNNIQYTASGSGGSSTTVNIHQFTLNGRQFANDESIGNH